MWLNDYHLQKFYKNSIETIKNFLVISLFYLNDMKDRGKIRFSIESKITILLYLSASMMNTSSIWRLLCSFVEQSYDLLIPSIAQKVL